MLLQLNTRVPLLYCNLSPGKINTHCKRLSAIFEWRGYQLTGRSLYNSTVQRYNPELDEINLFEIVSDCVIVKAEKLYENSIGVAKEYSCFSGINFFFLAFPHHESALQFMVYHYSTCIYSYDSILSSFEVLTRLIS